MKMTRMLVVVSLLLAVSQMGCAAFGRDASESAGGSSALRSFQQVVRESVKKALPSVVEVVCEFEYDVYEYFYAFDRYGNYIPDPASPFGLKRASLHPDSLYLRRRESTFSFGAGTIIGEADREFLILTSRHIVVHDDSIKEFVVINKKKTDAPLLKAYLLKNNIAARGSDNLLNPAELFAADPKSDLALLLVRKKNFHAFRIAHDISVSTEEKLGQLGLIIGFPEEISLAAIGIIGKSPYPGNFSIGATGNFGFSGGPVFGFGDDNALSFLGVARSLSANTIRFIAPGENLSSRAFLTYRDIPYLRVQSLQLVNPARMHAVRMKVILSFLQTHYQRLQQKGMEIASGIRRRLQAP